MATAAPHSAVGEDRAIPYTICSPGAMHTKQSNSVRRCLRPSLRRAQSRPDPSAVAILNPISAFKPSELSTSTGAPIQKQTWRQPVSATNWRSVATSASQRKQTVRRHKEDTLFLPIFPLCHWLPSGLQWTLRRQAVPIASARPRAILRNRVRFEACVVCWWHLFVTTTESAIDKRSAFQTVSVPTCLLSRLAVPTGVEPVFQD